MKQRATLSTRSGGVLLHLTSLPGPRGIGDLGRSAYSFVDFLAGARQTWWQMLPVGPVGRGNSPYRTLSAFAGFPLLISLESLARDGLLSPRLVSRQLRGQAGRVDYAMASQFKLPFLRRAFEVFQGRRRGDHRDRLEAFRVKEKAWLEDWALFATLRDVHGGASWVRWHPEVRARHRDALARARRHLRDEILYHEFLQYEFFRQWEALRRYSARRGIGLIGDLPIFVASDSVDVWAHPELFQLRRDGWPSLEAGVPPDYFSKTGQLWGNPVYRWETHRKTGYWWWIARMKAALGAFDAVRLDHFIGFLRCWAVPGGARTAVRGRWMRGPGEHLLEALRRALGQLPVIAEDLGVVTPNVKALRERFDLPGMKVLQFAFGKDPEANSYQPHNYPRSCVVYTGTHDNDTIVGWFEDRGSGSSTRTSRDIRKEREFALRYLGCDGQEIHWQMIRAAWASPANVAIVPAQDLLGLGAEARMNLPGREIGNWEWKLRSTQALDYARSQLARLTETYGRTR